MLRIVAGTFAIGLNLAFAWLVAEIGWQKLPFTRDESGHTLYRGFALGFVLRHHFGTLYFWGWVVALVYFVQVRFWKDIEVWLDTNVAAGTSKMLKFLANSIRPYRDELFNVIYEFYKKQERVLKPYILDKVEDVQSREGFKKISRAVTSQSVSRVYRRMTAEAGRKLTELGLDRGDPNSQLYYFVAGSMWIATYMSTPTIFLQLLSLIISLCILCLLKIVICVKTLGTPNFIPDLFLHPSPSLALPIVINTYSFTYGSHFLIPFTYLIYSPSLTDIALVGIMQLIPGAYRRLGRGKRSRVSHIARKRTLWTFTALIVAWLLTKGAFDSMFRTGMLILASSALPFILPKKQSVYAEMKFMAMFGLFAFFLWYSMIMLVPGALVVAAIYYSAVPPEFLDPVFLKTTALQNKDSILTIVHTWLLAAWYELKEFVCEIVDTDRFVGVTLNFNAWEYQQVHGYTVLLPPGLEMPQLNLQDIKARFKTQEVGLRGLGAGTGLAIWYFGGVWNIMVIILTTLIVYVALSGKAETKAYMAPKNVQPVVFGFIAFCVVESFIMGTVLCIPLNAAQFVLYLPRLAFVYFFVVLSALLRILVDHLIVPSISIKTAVLRDVRTQRDKDDVFEISVSSKDVVRESLGLLEKADPEDLKKVLKIKIEGESVGVADWVNFVSEGLTKNKEHDLFVRGFGARVSNLNVKSADRMGPLGRFFGLAAYHAAVSSVPLTPSLFSILLDERIDFKALQDYDLSLGSSLGKLRLLSKKELDASGTTFQISGTINGEDKEVNLMTFGDQIKVTEENLEKFLQLAAEFVLHKDIEPAAKNFHQGFWDVFPKAFETHFTSNDLSHMLKGLSSANLEEWRAFTELEGYSDSDWVVKEFWKILRAMNKKQRLRLYKYITNFPRPPSSGFQYMDPPMAIRRLEVSDRREARELMPKSIPLENCLYLPEYKDKDIFQKNLNVAPSTPRTYGVNLNVAAIE